MNIAQHIQIYISGVRTPQSSLSKSVKTSVIKSQTPRNITSTPHSSNDEDQSSITDNLLNLPKKKRNESIDDFSKGLERAKASDFF